MVSKCFSNKKLFKKHNYASPKASNVKYFRTLSLYQEGISCVTKLSVIYR